MEKNIFTKLRESYIKKNKICIFEEICLDLKNYDDTNLILYLERGICNLREFFEMLNIKTQKTNLVSYDSFLFAFKKIV